MERVVVLLKKVVDVVGDCLVHDLPVFGDVLVFVQELRVHHLFHGPGLPIEERLLVHVGCLLLYLKDPVGQDLGFVQGEDRLVLIKDVQGLE